MTSLVSEAKQRGSIDRPKGAKELPKPSKTKESSASAKVRIRVVMIDDDIFCSRCGKFLN